MAIFVRLVTNLSSFSDVERNEGEAEEEVEWVLSAMTTLRTPS